MRLFDYMKLKRRTLLALTADELKAQWPDQHLVNEVCYSLTGRHIITELADGRFRRKTRLRFFMIVTFLLAKNLCNPDLSITTKSVCFKLLRRRRARIQALIDSAADDEMFNQDDIAELDWISAVGLQQYGAERREQSTYRREEDRCLICRPSVSTSP